MKRNVIANYAGQGWRALMGLAFIPLYIKYLGIEAYGLIGIFAILQAWLGLFDLGMKPALGREMARFTGGAHDAQSIRDLLRSVEIIGIGIAAAIALAVWVASGWLAANWVVTKNLSVDTVAEAFALMGSVTALSFVESIYVSCITGLQRQVLQNILTSVMATARGLGAVAVLAWVSPTIKTFFVWQCIVSMITVAVFSGSVYRTLPRCARPGRFSAPALIGIWRFAAGTMAITFLSLLLTQVDRILLSSLLTLEAFAYYALAGTVANALYYLAGPITVALYPRFTELAAQGDEIQLRAIYHQGAQLVTVLMGAVAVVLIVFGDRVLRLWTGDAALSHQVAPLLAVLALGNLFNGLMWIPYHLQLAHGWTTLAIKTNVVAVAVLVPSILWLVPQYGAIAAGWLWVSLNAGYLISSIYFMHRRLLPTEKWRWYIQDVAIPLSAATIAAALFYQLVPNHLGKMLEFGVLMTSAGLVLIAAALAAPMGRHQLARHLLDRFNKESRQI